MNEIVTIKTDAGLVLVAQPIANVASAALHWALPLGTATDPEDGDGQAAMLSELVFRGAGGMSSREHSDALDRLGVRRNCQVHAHHLRINVTLVGDRIDDALPLITPMVTAPAFPEDAIEPVRRLCLQSLEALNDDPQHLVMLRLREQHLPPPFGRHGYGERAVLERQDRAGLLRAWEQRCRPDGAILAAAGAVDPESLARRIDALLADWSGAHPAPRQSGEPARGTRHVEQDSAQVHIGLAYDAPRDLDDDSMLERVATAVLSGSTSGRLFTEVRQKRSLCYSVGASYRPGRDRGWISLYAGTTAQRAQETVDVCIAEIDRLFGGEGVRRDEFDRAVIGLKSQLIMQGESTPSRAAALVAGQFRRGRARTLDEVAREIDAITLASLNEYLARRDPGPFTLVCIGPTGISVPDAGPVAAAPR